MRIPAFDLLKRNYPDYWNYKHADDARKLIGGETLDRDITNTCTIRLSHAMNLSGVPVPYQWDDITNRRGKNRQYYIIRVKNFRTWMEHKFGKPDYDFQKTGGTTFDRSLIPGVEGVIAFDIGFKDATGHFDLWYQTKFSRENNGGEEYFDQAHRISLWTTGSKATIPPA